MNRAPLIASLLVLSVLLPACGKKRPPVPPSSQTTSNSSTRTPGDVPRSVPPPVPQSGSGEGDIWSADLDRLNQYLQREGLLGDVYFAFDQSSLSEEALDRLDRNARFLREHPELVVTIEGHCDERGTGEYNLALGERRAGAALSRVLSGGIATSRLRRVSFGKERPVCTDLSESCWSLNRRAAFVVTSRATAG